MLKVICKSGKTWIISNIISLISYLCNRILDADILLGCPRNHHLERNKSKLRTDRANRIGVGFTKLYVGFVVNLLGVWETCAFFF